MSTTIISSILNDTAPGNLSSVITAVNAVKKQQLTFKHGVKIFVLRNYTIEGIDPFLHFHLFKNDIKPEIIYGDYGVVTQYLLDPDSVLYSSKPNIILLSLHLDNFATDNGLLSWDSHDTQQRMISELNLLKQKTSALIICNSFLLPLYSNTGITNSVHLANQTDNIIAINKSIRTFALENSAQFFVIDLNMILLRLGYESSIDERYWYLSKAPFKKEFLNEYAFEISKIMNALKGRSKKCIVLDCDNTLWGGVIGEDGLDGIKLDNDTYPGKIYYEFQKTIINLYNRGVIITLCSKNNEADVFEVLENHPYCLIKKEHLASWKINWNNKASNINDMILDLNIGLDSVVFVDDSDMECGLVKSALPDVTVMQVPTKNLFSFPHALLKYGWFDTLSFSEEDKNRTKMYQSEMMRKESLSSFENLDEYLTSLEIVVNIEEVQAAAIARVAQLTQKTNQFNLTTRRYSEADITNFANANDKLVYTLNITDKYGDMGLTAVLVLFKENETALVDSLLLSCRILGRNIEIAFVQYCLMQATKKWGTKKWNAQYIATKKNSQTSNFMEKFGFKAIHEDAGIKDYECTSENLIIKELPYIQINNNG